MKKIIFLCFSVVFTNFIWAQTVSVNPSPLVTEVGIPTNYSLTLNPGTSAGYTHYRIDHWLITANIGSGTIAGSINGQNTYSYFYNPPLQASSLSNNTTINIPITYGSNAPDSDNIEFQVSGFYGTVDSQGNFLTGPAFFAKYTKQNGDSGYPVDVKIVCSPTINNPTILDCCSNNVQFCATGYCDANAFTWTISGATIVSGQGTSCVSVTPNINGNVTATCLVKRSTGLASYTATSTKNITRTARTASFTPNYSTTPPYNYICKGSGGLQMNMPSQCGISNINWFAPNCTISGQNTLTPTITPTSAIPTGDSIDIYAEVSFTGGCIVTTPVVSFKILDSTTAQTPQGYFTVTSSNGTSICTAEIFDLSFVSTDGFNNGITTVSPEFLWGPGDPIHYKNGKPTTVTVSNKNLCTGLSTSKTFSVYPPAPCASNAKLASKGKLITSTKVESTEILASSLLITPNPTNGTIKAMLSDNYSGNYQIFDINGVLLQEAKFDNQTELQIELSQKLKSGIYILKVITETTIFTGKIILDK